MMKLLLEFCYFIKHGHSNSTVNRLDNIFKDQNFQVSSPFSEVCHITILIHRKLNELFIVLHLYSAKIEM